MLTEFKTKHEHCFIDEHGRLQGEYKWVNNGELRKHCFYVNGKKFSFGEIPLPPKLATEDDRVYYLLKYGLQLLPVETVC